MKPSSIYSSAYGPSCFGKKIVLNTLNYFLTQVDLGSQTKTGFELKSNWLINL